MARFVLEVELDDGAVAEDAPKELGRILRFWAGNVGHYRLVAGAGEDLYDTKVGTWRVED